MRQVEVMEAHLSTPRLQAVRAELKQIIRGVRLENHLRRLWAKVNKNGPVSGASLERDFQVVRVFIMDSRSASSAAT